MFLTLSLWMTMLGKPVDTLRPKTMGEVAVQALRYRNFSAGVNSIPVVPIRLTAQTVAQVLDENSSVFVRNSSPGVLNTLSLRGGGASQSAILWEGFNLNSPMVSTIDLSLLPTEFFGQIRVLPGSQGVLWGSSAMAGAVQLENALSPDRNSASVSVLGGSFGQYRWSAEASVKSKFRIGLFQAGIENDFPYRLNALAKEQRLSNAAQLNRGAHMNVYWDKSKWNFRLTALYLWTDRSLPPSLTQLESKANQWDESLRLLFSATRSTARFQHTLRSALFHENLVYADPAVGLRAPSQNRQEIVEYHLQHGWHRHFKTHFLVQTQWQQGWISDYPGGRADASRLSLALQESWQNSSARWKADLGLRKEISNLGESPLLFFLGLERQLTSRLRLYANTATHFRSPSLNDRFWSPGGNPSLKPESGWGAEIGVGYALSKRGEARVQAWRREIQDQIVWLPSGSYWTPRNLESSLAYGLESQLSLRFMRIFTARASYTYTISKDEKTGFQLMYVPLHSAVGNLQAELSGWRFWVQGRLTSSVFTVSDESDRLPSWGVLNAGLEKKIRWKGMEMNGFLQLNNLTDQRYFVMAYRPQPGVSFQVGARLSLQR